MNIFDMLSRKLIDVYHQQESEDIEGDIFTWFETSNGKFGFKFMRNYSGKVASEFKQGKVNRQQGLFDIQVITGIKFGNPSNGEDYKVTHKDCCESLIDCCNVEQVLEVWRGKSPLEIGDNDEQKETLATMAMLMFEQEINWGDWKSNPWQYNRHTHFAPYKKKGWEEKKRPRDMILGFILQGFENGIEEIKYPMTGKRRGTWYFGSSFQGLGYANYPSELKMFFTQLKEMDGGKPVLYGEILDRLHKISDNEGNNPRFSEF